MSEPTVEEIVAQLEHDHRTYDNVSTEIMTIIASWRKQKELLIDMAVALEAVQVVTTGGSMDWTPNNTEISCTLPLAEWQVMRDAALSRYTGGK